MDHMSLIFDALDDFVCEFQRNPFNALSERDWQAILFPF